MLKLSSKLNEVIHDVYKATTVDEAKKLILDCLENSRVNDYQKHRMTTVVGDLKTLLQVQTYATNSMFMFEGLGVGKKQKAYDAPEKTSGSGKASVSVSALLADVNI